MRIAVRYDMADASGETRRQRNARFKVPSPVATVSEDGAYLLAVYWELNTFKGSGLSGPEPLMPGTIKDWMETFKTPLSLDEIRVVKKLDDEFNRTCYAESAKPKEESTEDRNVDYRGSRGRGKRR